MTTINVTITNDITARFKTQVADNEASLTVRYPNESNVKAPDDQVSCTVSVVPGDSQQITVGVDQFRHVGLMSALIKAPAGDGIGEMKRIADVIVTAFRNVTTANNVRFKTPRVLDLGRKDQSHEIAVQCPYWVDETS